MKDKEKQIEEIAKVMCGNDCEECAKESAEFYKQTLEEARNNPCLLKNCAKNLYEQGYLKLPEDSVVLSREEYEKLRSLYDCEQGSYMTSSIGDLPLTVKGLRKAVDEITRLNRVESELQELNAKYYNEAKDSRRELKQARKETAEKIYTKIKDSFLMNSNNRYAFKLWIEEQFGLEIKE